MNGSKEQLPVKAQVDVLVVGGGNAALCAAITAREQGANVLLLESSPEEFRGGNSRHTRNLRSIHRQANSFLTGPYLEDECFKDLRGAGQHHGADHVEHIRDKLPDHKHEQERAHGDQDVFVLVQKLLHAWFTPF